MQALITDSSRAQPIRLRALAAVSRASEPVGAEAFALLLKFAAEAATVATRVDAAQLLGRVRLTKEQLAALAPLLATVGPIELAELLKLGKKLDATNGRAWAERLAQSPVFGAVAESAVKTAFSSVPPEVYERILGPAVRAAAAVGDAKKRKLETLAAAAAQGRAAAGRAVYERSACVACHQAGDLGRALGPDLSHIGRIRQPRDLLESILFPSATIARDFETYQVETGDGQTHLGTIKSDSAAGLVLLDPAGQEKTIPHSQIVAKSALATSLMPAGLEQTFSDQQLLDLIAWLVSLK